MQSGLLAPEKKLTRFGRQRGLFSVGSTFDVKWYTAPTLAYWVRELPAAQFKYEQIVNNHSEEIIETGERTIDSHRTIRWTKFPWGWVIETCHYSTAQTTTIETLISYDARSAVIVHRLRFGPNHTKTMHYSRDYIYPVPSIVWIFPCSEQLSYRTLTFAKA